MADNNLQSIVDELAERLRRSVAIDDPSIRLLAASRHFGDEDELRIRSVLDRSIEPAVSDKVFAHGTSGWTSPGVVEVEGALPRLCAPIRCNGLLLGYLWLIDENGGFGEDVVGAAAVAAERAGTILYRELLVHERSKARHEAILRELVSPDAESRARAVEDLRAEQLFSDDTARLTVLAVQLTAGSSAQDVAFEAAVEDGVRAVIDDVALVVVNPSRAWILLAGRRELSRSLVAAVAERVTGRFARLSAGGGRLVFGLGTTVPRLPEVVRSYQQAFLAARVALLVPGIGDIARWGALGLYELLMKLPVDDLLDASHIPALTALEREDNHHVLTDTLSQFLHHAGNIQRTADILCIHRATLYQRVKRIEQITGLSLDSGDDRLTLHLGLKLRELAAAHRDHFGAG
ncbi:CdaR family transcriptional regulator [Lentzea guizhouensis]|uniref:CdaR family transcriptional regulator n=1 Tax=Lentzea guizhouensis TaxID=1586287 RepID=A0A1B2HUW8_9PSEU|nr:helix-turn-helix domain-containing protein [Lentzea guizhouensis]ANZ41482.1 CdaR family transcriptional regulator [Lentzea guizhouensis]